VYPSRVRALGKLLVTPLAVVMVALTALAVAPLWRTHLLPFQDYPQILTLARAWGDCTDPTSPFFGTYERGMTFGPLLLPILLLRGIGAVGGLELAGRVMWTLYVVGLPLAALHLLRSLGREGWAVLLVFPLIFSYWVTGGFFAFATAAPFVVLGLSFGVRWLRTSAPRDGGAFALIACGLQLWHALAFAQLAFAFGILWCLCRFDDLRARSDALSPLLPSTSLFLAWLGFALVRRTPGDRAPTWPKFFENAQHLLDAVGPLLKDAPGATVVAVVLLVGCALGFGAPAGGPKAPFRVANPFGWVALAAALSYFALPGTCFGVEGIANRQPWFAALLAVFAFPLPDRRFARALVLGGIGAAGAVLLFFMGSRFAAFDAESAGASRLIDRLQKGDTLLAPIGGGATDSFPEPAKPLVAVEQYATIRHGGLPDKSFAGYDTNIVRYVNGTNPMPGFNGAWRARLPELRRFDYLLMRIEVAPPLPDHLHLVATDGAWRLYAVCASRAHPQCP
jgi:hypothetical protein